MTSPGTELVEPLHPPIAFAFAYASVTTPIPVASNSIPTTRWAVPRTEASSSFTARNTRHRFSTGEGGCQDWDGVAAPQFGGKPIVRDEKMENHAQSMRSPALPSFSGRFLDREFERETGCVRVHCWLSSFTAWFDL